MDTFNIAPNSMVLTKHASVYVILKITERCNLACPYCYVFFSDDKTFEIHPATILDDTVDGLIVFLHEAIRNSGIRHVHIGLHGGEPLLLKKPAFRKMCTRLRTALDPVCALQLSIQTNGVLIDPEWVDVFAAHGVNVGISFDGTEEIHNRTRVTKKGRGTYAESRRGWNMIVEAHQAGRIGRPGILCVVAPEQSGRAIYEHFVNELRARHMNFLWPNIHHGAPEATEAFIDGCGDFMVDVCRAWFAAGKKGVEVRFLKEIIGPLLDDEVCRELPSNRNNPFELITVSSNGEISPDDVIRTLAPRFRETGYRVGGSTLNELARSNTWMEVSRAQQILPEPCQSCLWRNICRSGSPQHRYSTERGFDNPSVYCKSLKRVFSYVADNLIRGGVPIEAIERRLAATFA
ncbi:radical SAM protein [Janthinobacterium fluminis]|uniref:Radical SAM protein n=1 Tax=Janthinobacterium fluminis TaxID=2987524 RepID=A0ABT5K024_9BURK|nr:radical SAM protein [Janthinobacterium fluminis]MDC8758313.1 radical SAM protein [Janthinobacterium fluminis]